MTDIVFESLYILHREENVPPYDLRTTTIISIYIVGCSGGCFSVPRYFSTVPDVTLLLVINTNSSNVLICIFELHTFF